MYAIARFLNVRTTLAAIALLFVLSIAYAFAATNVVPSSGAGDGSGAISGYTVSNVDYLLTDGTNTDPTTIDRVTMTLADTPDTITVGQPREVKISLISGGVYFNCTMTGWNASCPITSSVLVSATNELRVIAVE